MSTSNLPQANLIPDKLINAKVYNAESEEMFGIGEVTLPEFSYMTESMSGLGLAGELDMPVVGHFASLTLSFSWNSITKQNTKLLQTTGQRLSIYGSMQVYDAGQNKLIPKPVKLVANVQPKKVGMGKASPGQKMDSDTEVEILSMQLWADQEELIHIDKLNFICLINGEDMLAEVRSHLGA